MKTVWNQLDRMRGEGQRIDLLSALRAARDVDIDLNWQDLCALSASFQERGLGLGVPPKSLVDALLLYVRQRQVDTALDPWAGMGIILTALRGIGAIQSGVGVIRNVDDHEIARATSTHLSGLDWILGNPFVTLPHLPQQFDLVVTFNPIGYKFRYSDERALLGELPIKPKTYEDALVALSSSILRSPGEAIFLLPDSFFLRADGAFQKGDSLGLHVNGVLAIPGLPVGLGKASRVNVVFFSRVREQCLFVGELVEGGDPAPLVENLIRRQPGAIPSLGVLVDRSEFRGWRQLSASLEAREQFRNTGLRPVPLPDVVQEMHLGRPNEPFAELPNSVYLPIIGTSDVVTNLDALTLKPQNYVQIMLKPDIATAAYVADFLNRPLGLRLRQSLAVGSFIPKISKTSLSKAIIYLPPIERQLDTLEVVRGLRQWRAQIDSYEGAVWSKPSDLGLAKAFLSRFQRIDPAEQWMESLPFPLASILWSYRATRDADEKNEFLYKFFEAATVFLATLMLSAFHHDVDVYRPALTDPTSGEFRLEQGTFGAWLSIARDLAKEVRRGLGSTEQTRRLTDTFGTESTPFLEAISAKKLYAVLDRTRERRNEWDAHGGIANEQVQRLRLGELENDLAGFREQIGDAFSGHLLLKPLRSFYEGGVHFNEVKALTGTRSVFRIEKTKTRAALDRRHLYFMDQQGYKALQLLPFVKMMESPQGEESACYFYAQWKRREGTVRWVSFNFGGQPERNLSDSSMADIVDPLVSLTNAKPGP